MVRHPCERFLSAMAQLIWGSCNGGGGPLGAQGMWTPGMCRVPLKKIPGYVGFGPCSAFAGPFHKPIRRFPCLQQTLDLQLKQSQASGYVNNLRLQMREFLAVRIFLLVTIMKLAKLGSSTLIGAGLGGFVACPSLLQRYNTARPKPPNLKPIL